MIVLGLAAYLLPKMFASPNDQVQVPRLAGLTADAARAKLGDAGLEVGPPKYGFSSKVAANRVIDQDPPADEFVDKGTTVTFTLSRGTHPTKVPNIIGSSRDDAETALQAAHLNAVFTRVDSDQPKGTVVSTDPTPGTQVPPDSDVTVNIARGQQKVPDVVGKTQAEAEQLIKDHGFDPQVSPDTTSTEPEGTVTGQTPTGRHPAAAGLDGVHQVATAPSSPPTSPRPPSRPHRRRRCRPRRSRRPDQGGVAAGQLPLSSWGRTRAYCRSVSPSYAGAVTWSSICSSQPTLMSGSAASARYTWR